MSDVTRNLIDHAARYLFTNGMGERAERLVLESSKSKDMGGWSEASIRLALEKIFGAYIAELQARIAGVETLNRELVNRCGQQCCS